MFCDAICFSSSSLNTLEFIFIKFANFSLFFSEFHSWYVPINAFIIITANINIASA